MLDPRLHLPLNTPMTLSNKQGYRGYMGARMRMQRSTPQHIQQLVMRDYCAKNKLHFLLSATEYCMHGCTLILDGVLAELDALEGIVMYSIYHFPESRTKRHAMYQALFDKGCSLHTAAEGIVIRNWADAQKVEDIWLVHDAMQGQEGTLQQLKAYDATAQFS